MAPIQSSLSSLVFLTLALILVSITQASSTSGQQLTKTGFQITLTSVDSGGTFTHSERLQRAVKRSRNRLNHFNKMVSMAKPPNLSSPVFPNGETEYLLNLSIGTPPISYSALMDTGSDLIWTQCKPCKSCFPQPTPLFDPKNSSSYSNLSCFNYLCVPPISHLPFSECIDLKCFYGYFYGGGAYTFGFLATENFTFGNVSVPKIGFGCGEDNWGLGLRLSAGIVGLGRGPLSLVSQLGESVFSYCLTNWNGTKPSTLLIGSQPSVNSTGKKTTPLIQNPRRPTFYYLSLEGITIGSTKLPVNKTTFGIKSDGSGGVIIDSGTPITYLENSTYTLVRKEFVSQVKLQVVNAVNSTGLDLCFKLPCNASSVEIPALVFNFTNADLQFPMENYMLTNSSAGLICLAMGGSFGLSIFGNMLQQNSLVVYDLFTETISFMPTECDKL